MQRALAQSGIETRAATASFRPSRPVARAGSTGLAAAQFGNQALLRRLTRVAPRVQAKLQIGAANDPLEAEADQVADHVMRMTDLEGAVPTVSPGPDRVSRKCAACEEKVSRKCAACEEEEKTVHAKAAGGLATGEAPAEVHETLSSAGRPMDAATRGFMEPRFGHDFGDVRIHADESAAESARSIGALAYATGRDVAFAAGQYQPGTAQGQRLLAHELAHVVQQRGGVGEAQVAPMVRRYGQYPSCTTKDHLIPYVWKGMPKAQAWVASAIAATGTAPATPALGDMIKKYFGTDALVPANLTMIHDSFVKIQASFGTVMYHCGAKGGTVESGAMKCQGQDAQTSPDDPRDVTLCFDPGTLAVWGDENANAYTLIHENAHRALQESYGHTWEGRFNNCDAGPPAGKFYNDNPSSYGCFAYELSLTAGAPAGAPAPAPAPSAPPSHW